MATVNPAVAEHAGRIARLIAWAAIAAPLITPLIHTAVLRYPALGAVMGILEVIYRVIRPTVPAPQPVASGARTAPPA